MNKPIKAAICQMQTGTDKQFNLNKASQMIAEAADMGAELVVLPEVFNSPYDTSCFADYAEPVPGPTFNFLSRCAGKHKVTLVGGTFIEKDGDGKLFNTSYTFDADGNMLGRHRKVHLFDIDIPGQVTFKESSVLSAGKDITVIKQANLHMGIMICYDCRFPELARAMTLKGAEVLVIPAGFNRSTGPLHWELLMRSRAVDNEVFVLAAGSAYNPDASYQAWGHSMIIDPRGNIIAHTDDKEGIILAELDLTAVKRAREEIPVLKHRREDVYKLIYE